MGKGSCGSEQQGLVRPGSRLEHFGESLRRAGLGNQRRLDAEAVRSSLIVRPGIEDSKDKQLLPSRIERPETETGFVNGG
jgi:hypothetical protein